MALELIDAEGGDFRVAQYAALAVNLAYLPEEQGAAGFQEKLGLDARLISVHNTQVYVATNDLHIVVAFRGSESPLTIDGLKDWFLTNADNLLILPEGEIGTDFAAAGVGARFHKGFLRALHDIWPPLFAAVDAEFQKKERKVWVTGHSLGGALAVLAAWRLQRQFIPVHAVYTFGAPMVGNAAASQAFEREFPGKIYRFVDRTDPVPKLPTMSLTSNLYDHCPKEIMIGEEPASENLAEGAQQLDDVWTKVQARVASHFMANYLDRIAKNLGDATG